MTAMQNLEEQLREMLECKICFEEKERQKLLPCQHTMCLDCLNQLALQGSSYKCPICNQENVVPNGGFEALHESLIHKQVAGMLVKRTNLSNSSVTSTSVPQMNQPVVESCRPKNSGVDLIKQRLEELKLKENDTLARAKTKLEELYNKIDEVVNIGDTMTASLNMALEELIQTLLENTTLKVSAIEELTRSRITALQNKIDMINDLTKKATEFLSNADGHTITNEQLDQAEQLCNYLEQILSSIEADTNQRLKAGDSVRLSLGNPVLNTDFLLSKQDHYGVGYIVEVDNDGDCEAVFPGNSRWSGNLRNLEYSSVKHSLPVVGDHVRIRPDIVEPFYKWGNVSEESEGYLVELKDSGQREGRQVVVDFDENHEWTGLFDELEVIPTPPLKVGEMVWIAAHITEPANGWSGVKPSSIGKLVYVNGGEVEVDFPECKGWKGFLEEIERSRRIITGDTVKVKDSVREPRFAWGGVDHSSVGTVAKILNSSEHGLVCKISFPGRPVHWQCLFDEIEVVKRVSLGDPKRKTELGLPSLSDLGGVECPQQ